MLCSVSNLWISNSQPVGSSAKTRRPPGATRGLDACLFVYPKKAWEKEAANIARHSTGSAAGRGFSRFMLAGAVEAEVDSAGRILIPDYLKRFASLRAKVVIAGVSDRIEIWGEEAWDTYTKTIERDADQFAESLAS